MPELPEVETVRRMLEEHVIGRAVSSVRLSGLSLRSPVSGAIRRRLLGCRVTAVRRHGKYLILDLTGGLTLLSHLGMSGRWLFHRGEAPSASRHVHVKIEFRDGSRLWFEDPRRFGLLRLVPTEDAFRDRALAILGPDPIATRLSGRTLLDRASGTRVSLKIFLMDQRRIAGIGNIYASEILHRARIDPRRKAGTLELLEWNAIASEIRAVLGEAIERMGTTFSAYRTLWNEPGDYGERLLVYDRAKEPCRRCGTPIRRIVQGQRSTFFCPECQGPKRGSRSIRRPARGVRAS
jgi:formamidopyrimidine-DNA glycosylase